MGAQKNRESLEMTIQDYEIKVRTLENTIVVMKVSVTKVEDDLQESKNELYRYQKDYEEVPFISHGT
jgi:hypothetical protein